MAAAPSSTGSLTTDFIGVSYGFSAITAALGSFNQASALKAANQYQAQVSKNNAQISQWQSSQAIVSGQEEEEKSDLRYGQLYATQRATYAANGVDISEGSPIDVLATTKFIGNVDAATIKDNALRQAWGYQVAGTNATNSGNFYSAAADNINPAVSASTSLLSSVNTVAQKWYTGAALGVPGYGSL